MAMNKFNFNEHKRDTWKCDRLIGHIISINRVILAIDMNDSLMTCSDDIGIHATKTYL